MRDTSKDTIFSPTMKAGLIRFSEQYNVVDFAIRKLFVGTKAECELYLAKLPSGIRERCQIL